MDRTQQVNFLRELASNIAANLGEGTAEELVSFALSEEAAGWNIDIPTWFDEHDRDLLVKFVADEL